MRLGASGHRRPCLVQGSNTSRELLPHGGLLAVFTSKINAPPSVPQVQAWLRALWQCVIVIHKPFVQGP